MWSILIYFLIAVNNIIIIVTIIGRILKISRFTAARGKKEDLQAKEADKNNGLAASETVKVQTPAKKNARGASNSSTER